MDLREEFGNPQVAADELLAVVRELLEDTELTQYELEKRSGVSQSAISRWLHGRELKLSSAGRLYDAVAPLVEELG